MCKMMGNIKGGGVPAAAHEKERMGDENCAGIFSCLSDAGEESHVVCLFDGWLEEERGRG